MKRPFTSNHLYLNYFMPDEIDAFDCWKFHKGRLKDFLYTAGDKYELDYMTLKEVTGGDMYIIVLKLKDIPPTHRQVVCMQQGCTQMTSEEYSAMLNRVNGD